MVYFVDLIDPEVEGAQIFSKFIQFISAVRLALGLVDYGWVDSSQLKAWIEPHV